jgi:hypothetical protein
VGLLRRGYGGQGGLGITGGEESRGQSVSPAAASGSIPARVGLGVEGRSFGKLPGGEAELLRVMWWSGVQRNGRSTVRPRRLRGGGKKEAAALEIFGDAGLGLGLRGVGAALCRAAEPHWRAGPGREGRRRSRVGRCAPGKKEERGKKGANR